ncbi:hypothetical protein RBD99_002787 [Salmonella enterica]|nr:hypothetical protein [Salmonella enterica]
MRKSIFSAVTAAIITVCSFSVNASVPDTLWNTDYAMGTSEYIGQNRDGSELNISCSAKPIWIGIKDAKGKKVSLTGNYITFRVNNDPRMVFTIEGGNESSAAESMLDGLKASLMKGKFVTVESDNMKPIVFGLNGFKEVFADNSCSVMDFE